MTKPLATEVTPKLARFCEITSITDRRKRLNKACDEGAGSGPAAGKPVAHKNARAK